MTLLALLCAPLALAADHQVFDRDMHRITVLIRATEPNTSRRGAAARLM
jgi:hypothetical protein